MDAAAEAMPAQCQISFDRRKNDTLLVRLAGNWTIGEDLPSVHEVQKQIDSWSGIQHITFDTNELLDWDSGLLTFLIKAIDQCSQRNVQTDKNGLPQGVQRLLALASAVPERKDARREATRESFLARVGTEAINFGKSTIEILDFLGEASMASVKMLRGKSRFRWSDFFLIIQECGVKALPIVSLISLLVGLILAFVGAVQLMMFGAQIYVASLVGVAMVRVMGAIMTGIIMAGSTGAAFAAQLGTMQVNEEIDALKTMGISPMEFLVLPRMLALFLMMPGADRWCGDARSERNRILQHDLRLGTVKRLLDRVVPGQCVRRSGCPGRVSQGDAVREKRLCGWRCDNFGCCDRNREHHCCNGDYNGSV